MSAVEQYDPAVDLDHVAATLRRWAGREVFVREVTDSGCEAWVDEVPDHIVYFEDHEAGETDEDGMVSDWLLMFNFESFVKVHVYRGELSIAKVERTTITLRFGQGSLTIALLASPND